MTATLLWKCNKLIVTQQYLSRYYGNATKDLTCHNIYCVRSNDQAYMTFICLRGTHVIAGLGWVHLCYNVSIRMRWDVDHHEL
jgi:hypothetical protein